jgi:ribonuclease HI
MSIFCDGSCKGNGTRNAVGGWAFAYWPSAAHGEPATAGAARLEVSPGLPATNQRAELKALLESLRFASSVSATIYTDSMYAINCTSVWGPAWKKAGWKRASGEPLQNLDLIRPLVDIWQQQRTPMKHVRGHQTGSGPEVWGNNWVDRAAVAAGEGVSLHAEKPVSQHKQLSPQQTTKEKPVVQSDIRSWFH